MTVTRVAAILIATVLLVASPHAVESASPLPSPPASALSEPTSSVDLTIRAGGEPCRWELGCLAGITITPVGTDVPVLEGTLDPSAETTSPEGSLRATLAPGRYITSVTALGVTEPAPEGEPPEAARTAVIGGCTRTVELSAERPEVELTAAMAWDQPACGIAIEPPGSAAPRPEVAKRIREPGRTPRFRPRGAPTVSTTQNGIKLELWVKDATLRPGQWLLAHLRVSNVGRRTIRHNGKFEDLDCPPINTRADTSDLFDAGSTWTSVAATYKERFFRDGLLTRTGLGIPRYARGNGCGDVGQAGRLKPGDVEDVPLAGMPSYWLRDQPLPPGTIHLTVGFDGSRRSDRVSVSTDVTLAGEPVAYPSPGQLVDAALSTPGFIETLERLPDPREWANTHVSSWKKPPYPSQPRLDGARDAPDGILEMTQFFAGSDRETPFVVEAVIDPWTAESYGASAWPGWVTPGSGSVSAEPSVPATEEPSVPATEEPSVQPWTSEGIKATSDLKAIAEAHGWTLEQAKAQQRASRALGRVNSHVARERPDIRIGGALSEEPGGAPSLCIKGPAPGFVLDLVAEAGGPIIVVDEQPHSFDELEERSIRVHQALVDAGYPNVVTRTNITGGGVIPASVLQVAGLPADPAEILAFVPEDLRTDVDLQVTIAPSRPSAAPGTWGPLAVVYRPGGFGPGVGLGPVTLRIGEACVWIESKQGRHATTLVFEGDQVDWRPTNRRILFTDRHGETVRLSDGDRIEGGGVSLWPPQGPEGESGPGPTPEPGRRWDAWLDEAWLQEPDASCPESLFFLSEVTVPRGSR